jgi:hypothetical protein
MRLTDLPNHEAAILGRLAGQEPSFSVATAEGLLALDFDPADKDRMHALSAKARSGKLTRKEHAEIEAYSRISSLLGILKSKARRALNRRGTSGTARTH